MDSYKTKEPVSHSDLLRKHPDEDGKVKETIRSNGVKETVISGPKPKGIMSIWGEVKVIDYPDAGSIMVAYLTDSTSKMLDKLLRGTSGLRLVQLDIDTAKNVAKYVDEDNYVVVSLRLNKKVVEDMHTRDGAIKILELMAKKLEKEKLWRAAHSFKVAVKNMRGA